MQQGPYKTVTRLKNAPRLSSLDISSPLCLATESQWSKTIDLATVYTTGKP
jgi:hypothetical protein